VLLFCEFVNLNCAYRCVTVEYELSVMDNLYLLRKVRKPLKLNVERESRSIHMMTYQQSLGLGLGRQLSESIRFQMTVSLAHKISIERHESKRCSMSDTYNDCYWLKSNYYQSAKIWISCGIGLDRGSIFGGSFGSTPRSTITSVRFL
jgi:hypothetical protein